MVIDTSTKPEKVNPRFFDVWDEYSSYVFGYVLSDGHVRYVGRTGYLSFHTKDLDILEKIKEVMRGTQRITKDDKYYMLRICNVSLIDRMRELGVQQRKSDSPLIFPDIPKEFFRHFLRGLIDGDGCIWNQIPTNSYHVCLSMSMANNVAGQLINKMKEFDFPVPTTRIRKSCRSCMEDIFWYGKKNALPLLELLYHNCLIFIDRKRESALQGIENYHIKYHLRKVG
jgi:hypothetical protein